MTRQPPVPAANTLPRGVAVGDTVLVRWPDGEHRGVLVGTREYPCAPRSVLVAEVRCNGTLRAVVAERVRRAG